MPRPVSGHFTQLADGTWSVSVPKRRGSTERRREIFRNRAAGVLWVEDVRQAFGEGRDASEPRTRLLLPADDPAPDEAPRLTPIDSIFEEFHTERYAQLRKASDGRAGQVRSHYYLHIRPTLQAMGVDCIQQLQREHVVAFVRHLAGWEVDDEIWLDGTQPDVPSGKDGSPGLLRSTARGVFQTLCDIVKRAQAHALIDIDPVQGIVVMHPPAHEERTHDQSRLTVQLCVALAARLPPFLQVAMWISRLVGLRVSEIFALRVRDVVRKAGWTVLRVGKSKTEAGRRDVPVGKLLAGLLWCFIEAVHGDVASRDPEAWLIPTPSGRDSAGYGWFRDRLRDAGADLDLEDFTESLDAPTIEDLKTHGLRKSLATDLRGRAELAKPTVERYIGHATGSRVIDTDYTLDGLLSEFGPLAMVMDETLGEAGVTDLRVPTDEEFVPWTENPLHEVRHELNQRLRDVGWLVDHVAGGDELWLTADAVADVLDLAPRTVRQRLLDGIIPGEKHPTRGWRVREADLDAYLQGELDGAPRTLDELAAEHGLGYHEAYKLLLRLDPGLSDRTGQRLEITDDHAWLLSEELARLRALHRRAMRVAEAARALGKSVSAINRTWIPNGLLDVDPETDVTGRRFVTRESVQRHLTATGDAAAMTITDAAAVLGTTAGAVRRAMAAGELVRTRIGRKSGVTAKSVRRYREEA